MPQIKIAHLRTIPDVDSTRRVRLLEVLNRLGRELGAANSGIADGTRAAIDAEVANALGLTEDERGCVARWAAENPLPKSGRSARSERPASDSSWLVEKPSDNVMG